MFFLSDTFQARGNLPSASSLRMSQRAYSVVDSVDCPPIEDPTDNLNGATLLGTGLKNEVGEYNCFLNVIIQVGLSFPHKYKISIGVLFY